MKRIIVGLLSALASVPAIAQVSAISGQAISQYGSPVPYASVRVCSITSSGFPCTPTVNLYSDYQMTQPLSNPTTADQYGNYTVYAATLASPNLFLVQVTAGTSLTYNYVIAGNSSAVSSISGQANGVIPLATGASALTAQSHLNDGVTTPGTITSTEPLSAPTLTDGTASLSAGSLTGAVNGTFSGLVTATQAVAAPNVVKAVSDPAFGCTNTSSDNSICLLAAFHWMDGNPNRSLYFPPGVWTFLTPLCWTSANPFLIQGESFQASVLYYGGTIMDGSTCADQTSTPGVVHMSTGDGAGLYVNNGPGAGFAKLSIRKMTVAADTTVKYAFEGVQVGSSGMESPRFSGGSVSAFEGKFWNGQQDLHSVWVQGNDPLGNGTSTSCVNGMTFDAGVNNGATAKSQAVIQNVTFKTTFGGYATDGKVTITLVSVGTADASAITVSGSPADSVTVDIKKADTTIRTVNDIVSLFITYPPTTTDGGVITASGNSTATMSTQSATPLTQTVFASTQFTLTMPTIKFCTGIGLNAPEMSGVTVNNLQADNNQNILLKCDGSGCNRNGNTLTSPLSEGWGNKTPDQIYGSQTITDGLFSAGVQTYGPVRFVGTQITSLTAESGYNAPTLHNVYFSNGWSSITDNSLEGIQVPSTGFIFNNTSTTAEPRIQHSLYSGVPPGGCNFTAVHATWTVLNKGNGTYTVSTTPVTLTGVVHWVAWVTGALGSGGPTVARQATRTQIDWTNSAITLTDGTTVTFAVSSTGVTATIANSPTNLNKSGQLDIELYPSTVCGYATAADAEMWNLPVFTKGGITFDGQHTVTGLRGTGPNLQAATSATVVNGNIPSFDSNSNLVDSLIAKSQICLSDGTSCPAGIIPAITIITSTPVSCTAGYYFNRHATAAQAIVCNLPAASAGLQVCIHNSYNGTAANTGTLTLQTSAAGQSIVYNGTTTASGGYVISSGAAGDGGCVVGTNSTQWELYTSGATSWAVH